MGNQQGIAIVFDSIVDHPLLMVCQGDDALHRRSPLITIPLLDTPLLFIHWDPNKVNEKPLENGRGKGMAQPAGVLSCPLAAGVPRRSGQEDDMQTSTLRH
jgi:hypothetical protein